ncbi:topoisomerase DNA-binding C4 zinc finger domain-containing protein [Enterocloster asparagiformis]|uniref:topoisomerase DNA-binding C4 zinc finger domain-containing protein n=1 Tax=Enterocloster asparagiformis TaxID=333367 RepID=UPI001FAA04D3|nr:topoisomerase DNA-binding C4 zinc finger domain-containing protein [Enterocloster asparagiformis]
MKKVECTSPNIYVIKRNTINHLINKICSSQLKVLTEAEIANIYTTLYPYTQVEDSTKDKHIADIKEKTNIPKAAIEPIDNPQKIIAFSKPSIPANDNTQADTPVNRICPKCTSPLVLRTTKKGAHAGEQFYGCSRFPKCRYHENL